MLLELNPVHGSSEELDFPNIAVFGGAKRRLNDRVGKILLAKVGGTTFADSLHARFGREIWRFR